MRFFPRKKYSSKGCGKRGRRFNRIVGGTAASEGEFPWMASLMSERMDPNYFCGGALISAWYVLTAAHCLTGYPPHHSIWVRLGEHDFSVNDEHYLDRRVAKFVVHPDFNRRTLIDDIALIEFTLALPLDEFMQAICLPPPPPPGAGHNVYEGKEVTVAGWGASSYMGKQTPLLKKVTVPVWSLEECRRSYTEKGLFLRAICAGLPEGGKDSCQFDSGGPLMLEEDGTFVVIGLTSWGKDCGAKNFPGVYTSVNMYLDWIEENTS
ncbi:trypsin-1-like [Palaemon carinicauda]|uniref:trypsin-1-like n=1 Tax=Palaemon carinicauda TaxID=392227 RepID=UPI0035B5E1AF